MTFVWKITCRRLQASGTLARYADGTISEQERGAVEAHLARCPACETAVANALAVADLLRANVPAAHTNSLAASGRLWESLQPQIARTPQEKALPVPARTSEPRGQRVGHWLATPGALPFGAVAAAAIGLVGIAVYNKTGLPDPAQKPVSVAAMDKSAFSEISIIPSPKPAAPSAKATRAAAPAQVPPAAMAVADIARTKAAEIAPIRERVSVRHSPVASPRNLAVAAAPPSAPRPRAFQMANLNRAEAKMGPIVSDAASPSTMSMTAVAPVHPPSVAEVPADFGRPDPSNPALTQGVGGERASYPDSTAKRRNPDEVPSAPSASLPLMAMTAEAGAFGATSRFSNTYEDSVGESKDIPAVPSLTEMALQQRRQRSLFSYATR